MAADKDPPVELQSILYVEVRSSTGRITAIWLQEENSRQNAPAQ